MVEPESTSVCAEERTLPVIDPKADHHNLEVHPIFARVLALVLEQLLELPQGRLGDMVMLYERGSDWESASRYYDLGS